MSQSLFNVGVVLRLMYSSCVIVNICPLIALFLQRFNQDSREIERARLEVVRISISSLN